MIKNLKLKFMKDDCCMFIHRNKTQDDKFRHRMIIPDYSL